MKHLRFEGLSASPVCPVSLLFLFYIKILESFFILSLESPVEDKTSCISGVIS